MGQMSWVLSCTYEQVLGYPARIVNDFARGLGLGLRGMLTTNRIVRIHPSLGLGLGLGLANPNPNPNPNPIQVRIHPSVEALQVALSYGSTLVYGVRVGGVDERRVILGAQYPQAG